MISNKLVFFALLIISCLIFVNVTKPNDLAYAQVKASNTKQCDDLYIQYLDLGVSKFYEKYSYLYTIDKCIALYKDPKWTFPGKAKMDQQSQRMTDVQNTLQSKNTDDFKSYAKITSKIKTSQSKYLVDFNVCAGKTGLTVPTVSLKSDLDSFAMTSKKTIPSGICKSFQTNIDSKYSDKIEIRLLESPNEISKYAKVKQM